MITVIRKMLNIAADNRWTPSKYEYSQLCIHCFGDREKSLPVFFICVQELINQGRHKVIEATNALKTLSRESLEDTIARLVSVFYFCFFNPPRFNKDIRPTFEELISICPKECF